MADILAGMGLQRKANDQYEDRQALRAEREYALERRKKDDAFREQTRPMELENLGLQRRATQMQMEQAERQAKMQEELRSAFSNGAGVAGAAEIARKYGDMDTYTRMSAYARKAEEEGMTDAVRWAKLGRLDEAARRYNQRGADKIDGLKLVDGRLVASVGGQDVDWGNLEDHARLLGLGDKIEWKDGQEYVNGQPTGKFAKPNPHDKDRFKVVKNADGSERLVDTHAPGAATSGPQRAGVSKEQVKRVEDLAKEAYPEPPDTDGNADRPAIAKSRADLAGFSKQLLEFNGDVEGMTPEIAHSIARDLIAQRRGPDGKLVSYRATYRAPNGEEFDGIMYQHQNGPRFYKLSDRAVRKAKAASSAAAADQRLPTIDPKYMQILRENRDNPEALKEFDERIGIPGAAKRYLDQDKNWSQGDVRKADMENGAQ